LSITILVLPFSMEWALTLEHCIAGGNAAA